MEGKRDRHSMCANNMKQREIDAFRWDILTNPICTGNN